MKVMMKCINTVVAPFIAAFCLAFITTTASTAYAAGQASNVTSETENGLYKKAIEDARGGHTESALEKLQPLVERFPERQDILGDYVVILGWDGKHVDAIALLEKVNRTTAPAYVLEGLATSARHLQNFSLAETLYREAIGRSPERVEPQIGLIRTLADTGRLDEAALIAASLRARFPRRSDVLEVYADIAEARADPYTALGIYQGMLEREPANKTALRGRIRVLTLIGAPQLAAELADRNPGMLTQAERDAIAADQIAHQIRWGTIADDTERGMARFAIIEHALAESDAAGMRALDPKVELGASERQLALDRIGALRERYRMRDAVALYQAMAARPAEIPAYVKSEAAAAYLYLEQPEKARDLYREALMANPDNVGSQIGLYYALSESEEHSAALTQIEHVVSTTPAFIDAWSPATIHENPAYARALSARAMQPLAANRPGQAQQRLHEVVGLAPYNMEIRTDYASSMRARGWPRAANEELRWILQVDPENSGALGERAGALLEMQEYRAAEKALTEAQAVAAEDGRVVRATRLSEVHNMRELSIDGTFGKSVGGAPTGTNEYSLDARLYSRPLDYNYRVFAHAYSAQATFSNGTGRRNRVGAGLEYSSQLITATGELSRAVDGGNTGLAASIAYTPNDYWTFNGAADTSTNELPLQASLANIDAQSASVEAVWRANESRSAAISYEKMDFSDGNQRDIVQTHWTERVVAGPVYQLEVTGALYASSNSVTGTPYFNPSHDFSPTVEFANEWLQWRRYTRSFRHRLVLAVGSYSQQGFATGPVYGARYEQEWNADDRLALRYGIGRSLHPYDGVQTASNYGYFNLNWRF